MHALSFERVVLAVEKVRERLLRSTGGLERAGVPYAVIGGNAVAVHVARVDVDAVRNTVDVNILLNRSDLKAASAALKEVEFDEAEVLGVTMFLEREDLKPRRAVHVIFAGEVVREHDVIRAPGLKNLDRSADGFAVIGLRELVGMKLNANRRKDQVHLQDMLELEMITPAIESALPSELEKRLAFVKAHPEPNW